jgi:glyoxylase-like metal-dependent hydrolase (beta-lactamase superfamily II)
LALQQVTSNVFVDTGRQGCNFGFLVTSDGVVMFDSPHRPTDAMELRAEIEGRGRLRYIINTEPHGDHWTGNSFFDAPVVAQEGVRRRILETDMAQHIQRVSSFGPDEPKLMEGYTPNAPVITFKDGMTLNVGDHTIEIIHMPGHTAYQAAICIKEEGVVWTSDNIFNKVQTFIQEASPDEWLATLEALRRFDEETFVPGHGLLCDKSYLDEQGSYIQEWKDYVWAAIERGMSKDEAIYGLTGMTDRYPMESPHQNAPAVMRMNAANLYDFLTGNWTPSNPQAPPASENR